MSVRVEAGECEVADEDMQASMMKRAEELLEAAGLYRYEVASYALPGYESLHNMAYWTGVEYLGLGAGAASMLGEKSARSAIGAGVFEPFEMGESGARVRVAASSDDLAFSESLGKPHVEPEFLSAREAALEDLMLGMRRSVGVARECVQAVPGAEAVFSDLVRKGLVEENAESFVPTERGWLMGNEIFEAIWDLA